MKQPVTLLVFLLMVETAAVIYLWFRPGRGIPILVEPSSRKATDRETEKSSDASPLKKNVEADFRQTLKSKPEAIAALVPRAPMMGGEWRADESQTVFIAPNFARVYYEDGHVAGTLILAIGDPNRPDTWKSLYDDPDPQ